MIDYSHIQGESSIPTKRYVCTPLAPVLARVLRVAHFDRNTQLRFTLGMWWHLRRQRQ